MGRETNNEESASASALHLEKQFVLSAALSYTEDNLINILPQLNVLFKQRRSAAEIVHKEFETGWALIEHIDNQIKQVLGLK